MLAMALHSKEDAPPVPHEGPDEQSALLGGEKGATCEDKTPMPGTDTSIGGEVSGEEMQGCTEPDDNGEQATHVQLSALTTGAQNDADITQVVAELGNLAHSDTDIESANTSGKEADCEAQDDVTKNQMTFTEIDHNPFFTIKQANHFRRKHAHNCMRLQMLKANAPPSAKFKPKGIIKPHKESGIVKDPVKGPVEPLCGSVPPKEYFSFINPGMDMCMDYSSQISMKSRDSSYVDRELLSKLYYPPQMQLRQIADRNTKRRAFKNLVVLGMGFMFVFTAFVSLQSLQSTLNAEAGVGLASLSCVYAATVLSCFVAPALIKRLTTKYTMIAAFVLVLVYISANFYPKSFLLIPASLLLGSLTGPLWSAQATYVTTLAMQYSQATQTLHDTILNRFTSIFMGVYQTSQVWGHVISIAILHHPQASPTKHNITSYNAYTALQEEKALESDMVLSLNSTTCGAHDCGAYEFISVGLPSFSIPVRLRNMLLGIHLAVVVLGIILIIALLDKNHLNSSDLKHPPSLSSQQLFFATLKIFREPCLLLLVPMVLFIGLEQGFVFGDYTKAYVTCALGIRTIGSVMICFGAVTAVSSFVIGYMAHHLKRFAFMIAGSAFSAGLFVALLWWRPKHDDPPMFYVIAACMGVCDAIWQTQTATLFGLLFTSTPEAAFASYRMLQAVGFALAFGYSHVLCIQTKLYILAGTLVVALVLYALIEYRLQAVYRRHVTNVVSL